MAGFTRSRRWSSSSGGWPTPFSSGPGNTRTDPTAHLASELGVLAFKRGYAEWSEADRHAGDDLALCTLAALDELRAATASLG